MPGGGSIALLWTSSDPSAQVAITDRTGAPVAFTVNGSAVSFPYALTGNTKFVTVNDGGYTLSVKLNGVEIASETDGTRDFDLYGGRGEVFRPVVDRALALQSATFVAKVAAPTGGDDTANVQAALDAADAAGGGVVRLATGTYNVSSTIVLPNSVILTGEGHKATTIRLANGANVDVVRTEGFATLTGTTSESSSSGVPTGFGVRDLAIDGNRANNTSGGGLVIYGKRYIIDGVLIRETAGDGFYSELGKGTVGGEQGADDMPECSIGTLWVYRAAGVGFHYRGPHDGRVSNLFVSQSGGDNVTFEKGTTYEGACDVGFMHSYGSQGGHGVVVTGTELHAQHIVSETNYKSGLRVDSNSCRIGVLSLFENWFQYGSHAPYAPTSVGHLTVTQNGEGLQVGVAHIRTRHGGSAILAQAGCAFGQAKLDGESCTGIGLSLDANGVRGSFEIRNYTGTGSYGYLHCSAGVGRGNNEISAYVLNCAIAAAANLPGVANMIRLRLVANAGQTADGGGWSGLGNVVTVSTSGSGSGLTSVRQFNGDNLATQGDVKAMVFSSADRLNSSVETLPRGDIPHTITLTSGTLFLSFFTAPTDFTVGHVETDAVTGSATAASTLARVGLYAIDGSGNLTLVASNANDVTLWRANSTTYTATLSAAYNLTAGTRYALGVIQANGNAVPALYGKTGGLPNRLAQAPRMAASVAGQSDLPASIAVGSLGSSNNRVYAALKA